MTIVIPLGPPDEGYEVITEEGLLHIIDVLEGELTETRRRHDALPSPEHINARRLLEKVGRRNHTAHW